MNPIIQLVHPYTYGEGYIMLDARLTGLPDTLDLAGTTYQARELHCSLMATKKIVPQLAELEGISEIEAETKVAQTAIQIINDIKPSISSIGPEFRIADQPERDRRTLVVMTQIIGLEAVFGRLNEALHLNVPTQITHITLYALNGLPIGITNANEFATWTRPLTDEETNQLNQQIDIENVLGATL
jgi:hypothetical protein